VPHSKEVVRSTSGLHIRGIRVPLLEFSCIRVLLREGDISCQRRVGAGSGDDGGDCLVTGGSGYLGFDDARLSTASELVFWWSW
jgi:hypothetical protein